MSRINNHHTSLKLNNTRASMTPQALRRPLSPTPRGVQSKHQQSLLLPQQLRKETLCKLFSSKKAKPPLRNASIPVGNYFGAKGCVINHPVLLLKWHKHPQLVCTAAAVLRAVRSPNNPHLGRTGFSYSALPRTGCHERVLLLCENCPAALLPQTPLCTCPEPGTHHADVCPALPASLAAPTPSPAAPQHPARSEARGCVANALRRQRQQVSISLTSRHLGDKTKRKAL